jgi:hypothetical protein
LIASGLALVSYHMIEAPSLRFRPILERLLWPRSSARAEVPHAERHSQTPRYRASATGGGFESRPGADGANIGPPAQ